MLHHLMCHSSCAYAHHTVNYYLPSSPRTQNVYNLMIERTVYLIPMDQLAAVARQQLLADLSVTIATESVLRRV